MISGFSAIAQCNNPGHDRSLVCGANGRPAERAQNRTAERRAPYGPSGGCLVYAGDAGSVCSCKPWRRPAPRSCWCRHLVTTWCGARCSWIWRTWCAGAGLDEPCAAAGISPHGKGCPGQAHTELGRVVHFELPSTHVLRWLVGNRTTATHQNTGPLRWPGLDLVKKKRWPRTPAGGSARRSAAARCVNQAGDAGRSLMVKNQRGSAGRDKPARRPNPDPAKEIRRHCNVSTLCIY